LTSILFVIVHDAYDVDKVSNAFIIRQFVVNRKQNGSSDTRQLPMRRGQRLDE